MQRKVKITFLSVLILILMVSGYACASGTSEAGGKGQIVIGATMQGLNAPYVVSVKKHLEAYAATMPNVKLIVVDGQTDPNKQVSQIENFIAQKVNGIILNPISFDGCAPAVVAAQKAGIPIVTLIVRVNNQDKATSFVGSDHKDSGIMEAELMVEDIKGKGNIVVIEGEMGIDAQIQRMLGYEEVLKNHPDITIVAKQAAYWDRDKALKLTENWLQSGKQFDVVLSQNDNMAMGALKAIEDAGLSGKVLVYGIDGDTDALEAVRDGRLKATVYQDAKGQAEQSIDSVLAAIAGKPVDKAYVIPFQKVTKANVAEFLK